MVLHGIIAVLLPHFVWPSLAAQGSILEQLFGMSPLPGSATPIISPANLSAVFEAWPGYDVAVFYYSPYGEAGKYSSQVLPLWDQVWTHLNLLLCGLPSLSRQVAQQHKVKKTRRLLVTKCGPPVSHHRHRYLGFRASRRGRIKCSALTLVSQSISACAQG